VMCEIMQYLVSMGSKRAAELIAKLSKSHKAF
jgi:hypothetical protein